MHQKLLDSKLRGPLTGFTCTMSVYLCDAGTSLFVALSKLQRHVS